MPQCRWGGTRFLCAAAMFSGMGRV
jgi:hypothetical protein